MAGTSRIKRTAGSAVLLGWLVVGGPLRAHHSLSAVYDIRTDGTLTGVVSKVEFVNPHGALTVGVDNDDGSTTEWVLTTGSANVLASLGFGGSGPNNVVAGDVVTIRYFPARNGSPLGFIRAITLADQREIEFEPD